MKYNNVLEAIGNTPHVRLSKLFPTQHVWIKLEKQNPGGSIKDRIALAMIGEAEKSGFLKPGGTIVEPTSGNTGVGLSMVAAVKGYKAIIVMPESMSLERRRLVALYGAELVLTPREKGMKGAIERAEELAKKYFRRVDTATVSEQGESTDSCRNYGTRDFKRFFRWARLSDFGHRNGRAYYRRWQSVERKISFYPSRGGRAARFARYFGRGPWPARDTGNRCRIYPRYSRYRSVG